MNTEEIPNLSWMLEKMGPDLRLAMAEAMAGQREWETPHETKVPPGCVPCLECGRHCMVAEGLHNDWLDRGYVLRIEPDCEKADNSGYYLRTEFAPPAEAVAEWNRMNKHD